MVTLPVVCETSLLLIGENFGTLSAQYMYAPQLRHNLKRCILALISYIFGHSVKYITLAL